MPSVFQSWTRYLSLSRLKFVLPVLLLTTGCTDQLQASFSQPQIDALEDIGSSLPPAEQQAVLNALQANPDDLDAATAGLGADESEAIKTLADSLSDEEEADAIAYLNTLSPDTDTVKIPEPMSAIALTMAALSAGILIRNPKQLSKDAD